jgi:hypothetical protein
MSVSTSSSEGITTNATRAERYAAGKALRAKEPRNSHGEWASASDRPDPISLLEKSNRTRMPELVPIRYGRMSFSPFAFLLDSAIVMESDLAKRPISGIKVQICGDAHVSNFGFFATPERNLVFDVNDFDETLPGPWESCKYRFFTSGRGNAPARGVFVVFDAPFPCAFSSCSQLKAWAVSGAR